MAGWEAVDYSRNDIMSMQQDAERRVREMQRKAQQAVMRGLVPPPPEAKPVSANIPEPEITSQVNTDVHTEPIEPSGENTQNSNTPNQNQRRSSHQQNQNFTPSRQRPTAHPQPPPRQSISSPLKNIGNMVSGLLGKDSGGVQNILSGFIKENREDTPIGKVMKEFNLDSEKLILIFLILVLLNDGADYSLILALGYILL